MTVKKCTGPSKTSKPMASSRRNLTGLRFHMLTVIGFHSFSKARNSRWSVRCDCGKIKVVVDSHLIAGQTKSCGCLRAIRCVERSTHGMRDTPEYEAYHQARQRCQNRDSVLYPGYGGRGIEFRFKSFDEFYLHIGPRPGKGYSLDRIDNEGHYEVGNVRWATLVTQNNNRRSSRMVNDTETVAQAASRVGINRLTLMWRLDAGWSVDRALNTPVLVKKRRGVNRKG